ncbi:hypothetical protein AB6831_04395 [Carnobacterium divergens]|uniref:hypothetical protein n=1 Tax=Carnobacterium divergens TaxID=2748 RepID=UPI0039C8D43A
MPKHEFEIENEKIQVVIDDNLILFFGDTLNFFPCDWNEEGNHKEGLNYYGYTLINADNLTNFIEIIKGWLQIIKTFPEEFDLTTGVDVEKDEYDKEKFKKENVINQLESLRDMCIKAKDTHRTIKHIGI